MEVGTETTLEWLGGGDPVLTAVVIAVGALVVGLTVYNHRKLQPPWRRGLMIGLRALIVGLLIAVFFQPSLLEERVAVHKNAVVVLADRSESMGLPHGDDTRVELARDWLERHGGWLAALEERHDVHVWSFAEEVAELGGDEELRADGRQTRIVEALAGVRRRLRDEDIGGVVLLTDGIDTSSAGRRASLGRQTEASLRAIDAPIHSVTTAGDDTVKDIAVEHVAYNNFAFLMNATSMDATVRVHGYASGSLPVRLTENGREIAEQQLHVLPGKSRYQVRFDFVPKSLGKRVYGVEVAPQPDEIYARNNLRQVVINVVRDKIRVVQIVGQPSWDERHLRNLLKENANVDLVSFFILVNTFNRRPVSSRETSLIPFPARELFEEELGGFDLLIFQNFNYGPFQTRQYLPHIAQYVRDGGAFAMVGGPLSLSTGGYYGTPIMDVLPVDIPPGFGEEELLDTREFRPTLTESGRYHPITRLSLDPAQNRRIWEGLTPLEGANRISRVRDDAVVVLEHPELETREGEPQPIAAVREVGEGRSMVVATDSTWHWSFKGGDPRHYETFWTNAIRWLIKDPELDLVRVKVLQENVPLGDEARAQVQVFEADYRPATNHEVDVTVRLRGPNDDTGQGEVVWRRHDQRTDERGELAVKVPVERAGIYEIEARADVVVGRTAVGTDLFVGSDTNPEFDRVVGDGRLLEALAEASGGRVMGFGADPTAVDFNEPRVIRVKNRQRTELWSAWPAILLIALLFGLEWWLRRRYGYL